jgi:hypothetical protein
MINRWCFPSFIVLLLALTAGRAQPSTPQLSAKDDYSQEAAVIEELSTKIAFENDGKFSERYLNHILSASADCGKLGA